MRGAEIGRADCEEDRGARAWADRNFETSFPSQNDSAPSLSKNLESRAGIRVEDLHDPENPGAGERADVEAMQDWFKTHWEEDFDITMAECPSGSLQAFFWRRTSRGWAVLCDDGWQLMG